MRRGNMEHTFSSPAIAKSLKNKYGSSTKEFQIDMRHEKAVRKYVMGIEDVNKKTSKSKVVFR
jgi:hypothetical protein